MTHFLLPLYSLPLKNQQIRRAYRNLITKAHPDKGGDAKTFALIQRAYDVLSDTDKRKQYDSTGTYSKSVEEELLDSFGGGVFRDKLNEENQRKESVAEAIQTVEKNKGSHTSGFEAFMRARGDSVASFGVDDIINQFGVVKGSYDEVQLPKIKAYEVNQPAGKKVVAGHEKEALRVETTKIASTLQWGEVLVSVRVAPMNAHDIYEDHMSFITSNYGNNASDANVHKDSMLNPRKGIERTQDPRLGLFSHRGESWRRRQVLSRRRLGHSVRSKPWHVENLGCLERKRFDQDSERNDVGKPLRDDARDVRRVSFVGRFRGVETRRCGYSERRYLLNRHGGLSTREYAQITSDFSLSRASRLRENREVAQKFRRD